MKVVPHGFEVELKKAKRNLHHFDKSWQAGDAYIAQLIQHVKNCDTEPLDGWYTGLPEPIQTLKEATNPLAPLYRRYLTHALACAGWTLEVCESEFRIRRNGLDAEDLKPGRETVDEYLITLGKRLRADEVPLVSGHIREDLPALPDVLTQMDTPQQPLLWQYFSHRMLALDLEPSIGPNGELQLRLVRG